MNNYLVSIIIPVFNDNRYISYAIESAINQTHSNIEIILIDDGSTDGSENICDQYAKADNRVLSIHQSNQGLGAARNKGIEIASGDYIAFLDSDDSYHPDYIKNMLSAMLQNNVDLVLSKFTLSNTEEKLSIDANQKQHPSIIKGLYYHDDALRALIDTKINYSVWNKLYRRYLWKDIRFPEGCLYEDVEATCKILDLCKSLYVIDQPLYIKRIHKGSITASTSAKKSKDHLQANSYLKLFVESNTPDLFSANQLLQVREAEFNQMILVYAYPPKSTDKLKQANDRADLKSKIMNNGNLLCSHSQCRQKTKIIYRMMCIAPWLIRIVIPLWFPLNRILWYLKESSRKR